MATRQKAKGKAKAKAQESPRREGGHPQKDHHGQKNRDDQKKAGEEGAGPANITQESHADDEGGDQAETSQPTKHSPSQPDRCRARPRNPLRWGSVSAS